MGQKPTRPVVTASAAQDGLRKRVGIDAGAIESFFQAVASTGPGGAQVVTLETFKAQLSASRPFFELGDVVSRRLFQVLGGDADGLGLEQLTCALYLFTSSTEAEKYRLLFNMFDLQGGGFIRKKEFRSMSMAIVRGNNEAVPESFETDFRALERVMTDAGMQLYDTNRDGKLSFEEWRAYAKEDKAVYSCFLALSSRDSRELVERIRGLA